MMRQKVAPLVLLFVAAAGFSFAQQRKPLSPPGHAATQVGGKWEKQKNGEERYVDGKWIEISYSRPILRGRENIFGSGADTGKRVDAGAPVWRLGANQTTRLHTEVALEIGGKTLEPGDYSLFCDLKESGWTLIVSKQPYQEKYDPKNKEATWGSYNYDPKYDVVRVPMQHTELKHSVDQMTIAFLDMTGGGGVLGVAWGKDAALVPFSVKP
jgi:Protein of unknown function (DUF2911)